MGGAALASGYPAWAAEAPQGAPQPIIVTGERAPRAVKETASSVTVITAEELERASGADRVDQILAGIPNVQLGSGGEGPTIRGQDSTGVLRDLPAFLGGTRPRVTLQVDGRAISYNEFAFGTAPLWDVERIEVFRSPQTTTQGRNSIAGAIFVETRQPTFDWEYGARLVAGDYDTRQASFLVSGPLVENEVAARISGDKRRSRPSSTLTSAAIGADPNEDRYEQLRFKLLATPQAVQGLRITGNYSHTRSNAPQVEGVRAPFRLRRDPNATYGIFSTSVDAVTLRGQYRPASTFSATANFSAGWATIDRAAPPGFGVAHNAASDRSAELIVSAQPADSVSILAGAAHVINRLHQRIDLTAALLGKGGFEDKQLSTGIFGEARIKLVPRLELTVGGRFQRDSQDREGSLTPAAGPISLNYKGSFEALLPKASLAYDLAPRTRIGVLVQKAFNPGGTTLERSGRADTFEAERLWDYEAFLRTSLAGGRVQLEANAFHYDIRNAQRSLVRLLFTPGGIVTLSEIANAPRARTSGAEVALRLDPDSALSLAAGVGLLRTRLTRALDAADPLDGKEFQRSPHFTGRVALDWRPLPSVLVSAQARHNSGYFSDDTNDPARRIGPATTLDLRGEWRSGPVTVAAYVRNVLDNFYLTYLYSAGSNLATAGDPRKAGISIEAQF
ncbi:TonB-dependent receptor [Novosphingobium tardum]|uniref:TonB-dependent receptor n=1 Tax=Novosphingobium tardum TaxID=1538021 RepID=A0ABV8RSI2_9SPHN